MSSSTSLPGLFTSNDRMTIICGGDVKSLTGTGIFFTMYSQTASMLYLSCAEIGTIGADSAIVPWMNRVMDSCWFNAAASVTRSTLFCRMIICCSRMISTAARCSDVWGCGHGSLAAINSSAPSMTAAPLSIVAMRISCPGQSTNDTCLNSSILASSKPGTSHCGESSFDEPYARYLAGRGHFGSAHP